MQIFPRGAGPRKTAAGEYKSPAKLLFAFLPLFNRDGRIAAVAETSRAGLFRVALTFNSAMTQFSNLFTQGVHNTFKKANSH